MSSPMIPEIGHRFVVSDVEWFPASDDLRREGLLGWVRFLLNSGLAVDGVMVRRSREGRLGLSFPERHDRKGRRHGILQFTSAEARAEIERQVLAALPVGASP